MHRFLVVIEKAAKNYSAYSPDLPGCVATGETREEADRSFHIRQFNYTCRDCARITCRFRKLNLLPIHCCPLTLYEFDRRGARAHDVALWSAGTDHLSFPKPRRKADVLQQVQNVCGGPGVAEPAGKISLKSRM